MCAIIAVKASNKADLRPWIPKLFMESRIRGRHATGVCYQSKRGPVNISESVSAELFLSRHWNQIATDLGEAGQISLIGHTRYATSGRDPQPIFIEGTGLVLNGVISQAEPNVWAKEFDFPRNTDNDAEIVLHEIMSMKENSPWNLPQASLAGCIISPSGEIIAFRNGKRPAWAHCGTGFSVIASTRDILNRVFGEGSLLKEITPGCIYSVDAGRISTQGREAEIEDLQIA